jgi:hypothetical protein
MLCVIIMACFISSFCINFFFLLFGYCHYYRRLGCWNNSIDNCLRFWIGRIRRFPSPCPSKDIIVIIITVPQYFVTASSSEQYMFNCS